MNVLINGKKYEISHIDTEDSIRNMVSVAERTLPKLVKILVLDKSGLNIQVELLSQLIKDVPYENLLEFISANPGYDKTDIALEWLRVNKPNGLTVNNTESAQVLKTIDPTTFGGAGVDAINTRLRVYKDEVETELKNNAAIVASEQAYKNTYKNFKPLQSTEFLQDSINVEYTSSTLLDPLGIFNALQSTEQIPFIRLSVGGTAYYKIHGDLVPHESWLTGDDTFILKIAGDSHYDEWDSITMNLRDDIITVVIEARVLVGGDIGDETTIVSNLQEVLATTDIILESRKVLSINGIFAIPELFVSRDLFFYLVTNDPFVSKYVYIDETNSISKKTMRMFYSTEITPTQIFTPHIFSISDKTATKYDIMNITGMLPLFTPYLNVRLSKFTKPEEIKNIQSAILLILDVYKGLAPQIEKTYSAVIPGFKEALKQGKTREDHLSKNIKDLQVALPDLFISEKRAGGSSYAKKCEPKKQPTHIDESKVQEYREAGFHVLNYPYSTNHYFICDHPEYKYPSLVENLMATNRGAYKWLPCCAKTINDADNLAFAQAEAKLHEVEATRDKTAIAAAMKTYDTAINARRNTNTKTNYTAKYKPVSFGQTGLPPKNVHYIMNAATGGEGEILRYGTDRSNNSFIAAVLSAIDPKFVNTETYLQNFRVGLTSANIATVAQELYDFTVEQYTDAILSETPFDSALYINLLQEVCACNIFVFITDEDNPNSNFEIPKFAKGYFSKMYDRPTIVIHKQFGRAGDGFTDAHYELVVQIIGGKIVKQFPKDLKIRPIDYSVRDKLYAYFSKQYNISIFGLNVDQYTQPEFSTTLVAACKGQVIDNWGKTRGLVFEDDIHIILSPIPQLPGVGKVGYPETRPTMDDVMIFAARHGLELRKADLQKDGNVRGFLLDLDIIPGVMYAYMPFIPTVLIDDIETDVNLGYLTQCTGDVLASNTYNKKVADFLMQYILYAFSLWYTPQPPKTGVSVATALVTERAILLNAVANFAQSIIVDDTHVYDISGLPREMTVNNTFFRNGVLITTSAEMRDKLVYYLRHALLGDSSASVLAAKNKRYLNNYYTSASEFDAQPDCHIFVGDIALSNWIYGVVKAVTNTCLFVPDPSLVEPYFFTHYEINFGIPVMIQNVRDADLNRAITVCENFAETCTNTGYDTEALPQTYSNISVYKFTRDGLLQRIGDGPLHLWEYFDGYFAAILNAGDPACFVEK